jgi:hypothetical protein
MNNNDNVNDTSLPDYLKDISQDFQSMIESIEQENKGNRQEKELLFYTLYKIVHSHIE